MSEKTIASASKSVLLTIYQPVKKSSQMNKPHEFLRLKDFFSRPKFSHSFRAKYNENFELNIQNAAFPYQ